MTPPVAEATARRRDDARDCTHDPALTAATRALVEVTAPALGLRAGDVTVHTGRSGSRAAGFGARGLAEGTRVYLAPGYDPATANGRALLTHELTHVAQARLPSPPVSRRGAPVDAEAEARALADTARGGGRLWVPEARIGPAAAAADNGAVGLLPRQPAPVATPPAVDAATTPDTAKASDTEIGKLRGDLGRIAVRRHQLIVKRMCEQLTEAWVDADNVRECLRALSTVSFAVARELVCALKSHHRVDLATTLDDDHHRSFPEAAIAVLAGLPTKAFNRVTVQNVEGLDPEGLSPLAIRAAREVLRSLPKPVLTALYDGPRGQVFRAIATGLAPLGDDRLELARALAAEEKAEGTEREELAEQNRREAIEKVIKDLRATLAKPSLEQAIAALGELASLAAPAPTPEPAPDGEAGTASAGPTTAPAPAPDPPKPGKALRLAVEDLEGRGAITRMLEALGPDERWIGGPHAGPLLLVLAARLPDRNLAQAEHVLSYRWDDWAVTDADARYAYLLVRSVPLSLQDRWKRLDEGKWFQRLESNIPRDDVYSGHYRGVGSEADAIDPGVADKTLEGAMGVVRDIMHEVESGGVTGPSSVVLVRKILAVSHESRQTSPTQITPDRRRALRIVVARLDTVGILDRILDALPDAFMLHEMWRSDLLELLAVRDARHIERHVRSLLSAGIFDLIDIPYVGGLAQGAMVGERDAWLAAQLIRQLPPADQRRLEAEDPERWSRIQGEMSPAMRASLGFTNLSGQTTMKARDRLRERLRDPALWQKSRAMELRSLIIQLHVLDDRRWVFLRSREVAEDKRIELGELYRRYGLYDAQQRPEFKPEALRADQGDVLATVGRWLEVIGRFLWFNGAALGTAFTDTIKLPHLDLGDLAYAMGGDIAGVRPEDADKLARAGNTGKVNVLGVELNSGQGTLVITLPELALKGFHRTFGGTSLRTGAVRLTGLRIEASFSDRGYQRPVGTAARFARADVDDAVASGEGLPGNLVAAGHLGLAPFAFKAGATGDENIMEPGKPGWVAIPVLEPFLQLLNHIVAFTGEVPGLKGLVNMPFEAMTAGSGFVAEEFSNNVASAVTDPLVDGMLGLVTDGVFRKPRTIDERARDAVAMMRRFSLSVGSLEVEGLSFGGSQEVASIKVQDLLLGIGLTKPNVLRTRRDSVRHRLRLAEAKQPKDEREVEALTAAEAAITAELNPLLEKERKLDALEARHRWNDKALSEEERDNLVKWSRELRETAGASLDVGGIQVRGLSGAVTAAGLDVGPIQGSVSGPSRQGEFLPSERLADRFQKERTDPTAREVIAGSQGQFEVGKVTLLAGKPGDPALRIHTGIPTLSEVLAMIAKMKGDARFDAKRAELERWVGRLVRLRELEAMPDEPVDLRGAVLPDSRALDRSELLPGSGRDREAEYQALLAEARAFFSVTVGGLELGKITARIDPAAGGLQAVVTSLEATGIETPTMSVAGISGEDVGIGVALDGGGYLPADLELAAEEAGVGDASPVLSFGAKRLEARGVSTPGLEVGRLTLRGLAGKVDTAGDDLRLNIVVNDGADLEGISYTSGGSRLFATGTTRTGRIALTAIIRSEHDPAGGPAARRITGVDVPRLSIARVDADHVGKDVTDPAPGYSVEIVSGALVGVTVEDLHLDLSGEDRPFTGKLSVAQLESLRFEVVSRALDAAKRPAAPTTLRGTIDTGGQAPAAGAVRVEFLVDPATGKQYQEVDLEGLAVTEGELTMPADKDRPGLGTNTVRVRKMGLNGHVTAKADGSIDFRDVGPLRIEVSSIDWHTAGGAHITAKGSTVLEGLTAAGSWMSTPGATGPDGKELPASSSLHLRELRVAKVTSDDLHYRDGVVDVHLGKDPKGPKPADLLQILDLRVRDLRWSSAGGVTRGKVTTGAAKAELGGRVAGTPTGPTRMGAAATVTDALFTRASVSATSIALSFHEKGRMLARVRGLDADVGLGETPAASRYHGTVEDLDTGVVDIRENSIEIGPDGTDGLDLKQLTVDTVDWLDKASGFGVLMPSGKGGGGVSLADVKARVRIELNPPGHPDGRFKRLLVRQFEIGDIRARGLKAIFPDGSLVLDETQNALIGGLKLSPLPGEDGFVVEKVSSDIFVRGKVDVGKIDLEKISADVKDTLKGSAAVGAESLAVEFLGVDGLILRVRKPSITNISAELAGAPGLGGTLIHKLVMRRPTGDTGPEYGIRAEEVVYTDTDDPTAGPEKSVKVKGTEVTGLEYANSSFGLHLNVNKATVPGEITHDFRTGEGKVPELNITDASFQLDLSTFAKTGGSGAASSTPKTKAENAAAMVKGWRDLAAAIKPRAKVVNALSGSLSFDLVTGDKTIPIVLDVKNGALDMTSIEYTTLPKAHWAALNFELSGSEFKLQAFDAKDLLIWDLSDDDVKLYNRSYRIKLMKLLEPTRASQQAFAEELSEDDDPTKSKRFGLDNVKADLSLTNKEEINIWLEGTDHVTLAPGAVSHLRCAGTVGGTDAAGSPRPGALEAIALDSAKIARTKMTFGSTELRTGEIQVFRLHDGRLTFSGMTPHVLSGTIGSATAKDINWRKK